MSDSASPRTRRALGRRGALVTAISLLATAALAAAALAASFTVGAGKAKVKGRTETVAVSSKGLTLYTLSGETRGHLKCRTRSCFSFWPPDKVAAHARLTKAKGVSGKLSKLHRDGFYQVMLNGHPLYTFTLDMGRRGLAKGQDVHSFGGTWHVIRER